MSEVSEVGRTKLYTMRERRRRLGGIVVALVGAVLCAWLAAALVSFVSGDGFTFPRLDFRPITTGGGSSGGLLGLPTGSNPHPEQSQTQFPVTLDWPASVLGSTVVAVPLWVAWMRFVVRPILSGLRREARHLGLASIGKIRAALGARAARKAGSYNLPGTTWLRRLLLPTSAFGYFLGTPLEPKAPKLKLWVDWEQRVRVVARTGWGKTVRLLVPIIRVLPGPAMVSSIEPAIFEQTVTARKFRRRPVRWWWWLGLLLRAWRPLVEYPIAVVDFSSPETRFTAGYPRVRWNPIPGCERHQIAQRRAAALVAGVESDQDTQRGGQSDAFFRDASTSVLAAWLHAAALGRKELDDMADWLKDVRDPVPSTILADDHRADRTALLNLSKHLSPAAEKTTSGVERYLTLAMESLLSDEGRELVGQRFDKRTGHELPHFDMPGFIAAGGTLYVLADAQLIEKARPLLSLVANEMFLAAEAAALAMRGRKLPLPFIGVLDELRYGVTVSNLPYVANTLRKYNIGYIYTCQAASQEDAVYGGEAAALRAAAGVTVYGGIDMDSAREISERAGDTPVVTATRGPDLRSEHIQYQPTLTVADQQALTDGQATIIRKGLPAFLAELPSFYENRRARRKITGEQKIIAREIETARAAELAVRQSYGNAAAAGATFNDWSGGTPATMPTNNDEETE